MSAREENVKDSGSPTREDEWRGHGAGVIAVGRKSDGEGWRIRGYTQVGS